MSNDLGIPYPIGTGSQPGDPSGAIAGILFDSDHDANAEVLSKLINGLYYDGNDALDKSSGAASCEIWLRTSEATVSDLISRKGATVGQSCQVEYTTGGQDYVFDVLVQENAGYPFIQFDSNDCVSRTAAQATAAIADYSSAAFIDALDIGTKERPWRIYASRLITQFNASEAATGETFATDTTAADVLATEYNVTKTDVELAVETGTGEIKAGQVSSDSIDNEEAFTTSQPVGIALDGSCEYFLYGQDIALGLNKEGAADSWAKENAVIKSGTSSQKWVSSAAGVGVRSELALDLTDADYQGKYLTIVAWIRSDEANSIALGLFDNVTGKAVDTQTYTANNWHFRSATKLIDAAAVSVYGVIQSATVTGGVNHYVDRVDIYVGEVAYDPMSPNPSEVVIHNTLENRFYNDFIFGDCAAENGANDYPGHAWLNGGSTAPFPWDSSTLGGTYAIEKTDFDSANASISAALAVGEGLQTFLGLLGVSPLLLRKYLGKACTFSCKLLKDGANTEDITLKIITDGTGGTTTTEDFKVNDYDTWRQVAVTLDTVPTDATYIRFDIQNDGANPITCFLDSFSITQTEYPISFTTLTPWQYWSKDFTYAGSQPDAATAMDAQGGLAIAVPIGINLQTYGITVFQGTAAAGDDLYFAFQEDWNGAAWAATNLNGSFSVTLGNLEDYESAADTDGVCPDITSGSRLGAKVDGAAGGIGTGSDAFVTLHCLSWGI